MRLRLFGTDNRQIANLHMIHTLCADRRHMPLVLLIQNVFRYTSSRRPRPQGEKGGGDAAQTDVLDVLFVIDQPAVNL
jgi:hypothetical protein